MFNKEELYAISQCSVNRIIHKKYKKFLHAMKQAAKQGKYHVDFDDLDEQTRHFFIGWLFDRQYDIEVYDSKQDKYVAIKKYERYYYNNIRIRWD